MQGVEGDAEVDQINVIVNRITANLAEPIVMADIAAELGMSESRFSRFFRRSTGNSFTDFVNRVRINSACHLLMQTDHYVTDICYQVGFNNVANFNRRFLEIKGMTPTEFRRQSDQPLRRRRLRITLLYLGLDLGTSELKALLLADDHRIVALARAPLTRQPAARRCGRSNRPRNGGKRWRPSWPQLRRIAAAALSAVRAIGLSGQMHGAVALDAQGRGAAPRHPLERRPQRRAMRGARGARAAPRRDRRQPRDAGFHRAQAPVDARARARRSSRASPACCCPRTGCAAA